MLLFRTLKSYFFKFCICMLLFLVDICWKHCVALPFPLKHTKDFIGFKSGDTLCQITDFTLSSLETLTWFSKCVLDCCQKIAGIFILCQSPSGLEVLLCFGLSTDIHSCHLKMWFRNAFCTHADLYQHIATSILHCQHDAFTLVVLVRFTPSIPNPISAEQVLS